VADFEIPDGNWYTDKDEWARLEGNDVVIGITDYAQQQLGDIVYVELPAEGAELTMDEPFGVIESVKAVSDLYAPISGTVTAINEPLADQAELVNEDCYGEGWIISVRPSDPKELKQLMDAAAYLRSVEERSDS